MKRSKPPCCLLDGATTNSGDLSWKPLEESVDLTRFDRTPPELVLERAQGCEGVMSNKVLLTEEVLQQLPDCKAVFLLSTGVNVVDLEYCTRKGIPVCNIPEYSTASVAELVFAYLFDWARGVSKYADSVRGGGWARADDFTYTVTPQRELSECTLGLIGFGAIAQSVAAIARSFDLQTVAYTPHPEGKPDLGQTFVSQEEVFSRSDIVSLHCPLNDQTTHFMNEGTLNRMKKGSVLINTARGGLVDEEALAVSLERGHIHTAYLDVLSREPPNASHPLPARADVQITPHIAWATRASRQRLLDTLVANVQAWCAGTPQNVVNPI